MFWGCKKFADHRTDVDSILTFCLINRRTAAGITSGGNCRAVLNLPCGESGVTINGLCLERTDIYCRDTSIILPTDVMTAGFCFVSGGTGTSTGNGFAQPSGGTRFRCWDIVSLPTTFTLCSMERQLRRSVQRCSWLRAVRLGNITGARDARATGRHMTFFAIV